MPEPMPNTEFTPENYENRYAGTPGDDTSNGTSGSDWMEGFDGNDRLNGGAGDDYIIAGSGNDGYVRGGTGADVFQFGLGDDLVKIFDWEAGFDKIRLVDGLEFDDLTISSASFNGLTTTTFRTGEGDRLDIRGFTPEDLSSADFISGESANIFNPSDYDTQITHDDTDSVLNGTTGTDFIRGGGGKDNIFGDAGDDYIDAGAGNDGYVRGGAGADVFEFGLGSDAVKIFDWEDGVDLIALRGDLSFDDLQISTADYLGVTTVSLTTASFDRLQIRDVDLGDIGVEDFILI